MPKKPKDPAVTVPSSESIAAVERHIRQFFSGHEISKHQWMLGPTPDAMPGFRVLCAGPGPRTGHWTYLSLGASAIENAASGSLEFFLVAPAEDLRHVELVTMVAWYHKTDGLGHSHTVPIGHPWLPNSQCDHLLVTTPYPFGPELEICNVDGMQVYVLWLLPITEAEREFKALNGLESLEQLFDTAAIDYSDPQRQSVA